MELSLKSYLSGWVIRQENDFLWFLFQISPDLSITFFLNYQPESSITVEMGKILKENGTLSRQNLQMALNFPIFVVPDPRKFWKKEKKSNVLLLPHPKNDFWGKKNLVRMRHWKPHFSKLSQKSMCLADEKTPTYAQKYAVVCGGRRIANKLMSQGQRVDSLCKRLTCAQTFVEKGGVLLLQAPFGSSVWLVRTTSFGRFHPSWSNDGD